VGGEGGALFDALAAGGALSAVLALFPEVVGRVAIDTVCRVMAGEAVGGAVITPAEVVTAETLADYYEARDGHWRLRPEVQARMCAAHGYDGPPITGRSIGFMLHYPSHEWYRGLAAAMDKRAAEVGARFVARNAEDEVAGELRLIKRAIGRVAAARILPGETLLVDGGECSRGFAEALRAAGTEVSVYTNALAILDILAGAPAVRVFLTAGEYQAATRTLVGPGVLSLLDTIRVDRTVVSPDGLSRGFGLSFDDEQAGLLCRRFCEVAREVVVLADHGVVGLEAKVQAVRPDRLHTVVTDGGTLSSHRLELSGAGLQVIVVDEAETGGPDIGTARNAGA
jgi:DeoR/GlpR family transcriptional regulator of sugar metabolism